MVPQSFNFLQFQISTQFLVLFFAFMVSVFAFWHEMRRDGFDEEKSFDLFIISISSGYILSRFTFAVLLGNGFRASILHIFRFWEHGHNVMAMTFGLLLPLYVFSRFWRWSINRLTDISSIAFTLGLGVILFGNFLVYKNVQQLVGMAFYIILFYLLYTLRLSHRSGLIFSLFLFFNVLFGLTFFRSPGYLIFYGIFFTIGIINLYYREKRNPMKPRYPQDLLNQIKNLLKRKEDQIGVEQKQLIAQDPYLKKGHDAVEYLDALNEDMQKEMIDLRLSALSRMKIQVRRALAMVRVGKYGICEVCGGTIEDTRLKAYPETTTCIKHSK